MGCSQPAGPSKRTRSKLMLATKPTSVRTVIQMINKWNPIAHDSVGFQVQILDRTSTPPHDPNFEYDLLSDLMLENIIWDGQELPILANSYIIPKTDWGDGWDDSSLAIQGFMLSTTEAAQ